MNRKHKTLKWGIALVSSMLTLNLSAQSSLIDYQSDKVDLGMGVEQSQMLTTASVEVVSGRYFFERGSLWKIVGTYGVASRRNGQ